MSADYIKGLIAVVGSDGTGKSTLTNDIVKRLQQQQPTERRYLGLISGEDGDKIKKLPLSEYGWNVVWLLSPIKLSA